MASRRAISADKARKRSHGMPTTNSSSWNLHNIRTPWQRRLRWPTEFVNPGDHLAADGVLALAAGLDPADQDGQDARGDDEEHHVGLRQRSDPGSQ